jgi:hypothetical protein
VPGGRDDGWAGSIDDLDLLRQGALPGLFSGVRAPSTLGSFLRAFTWGNVLQLQQVHREFLAELAARAPLLPGADVLAFIDIDSQQKRVYGHAKQGAAFGFTKISQPLDPDRADNRLGVQHAHPLMRPTACAAIDSERCSHRRRCAPASHSPWAPWVVRGVSFDDHLDRDDLVVRLAQFHPLVIPGARR